MPPLPDDAREEVSRELLAKVEQMHDADLAGNVRHAVKLCEEVISGVNPKRAPYFWSHLQGRLGQMLLDLHKPPSSRDVERAIAAYSASASVLKDDRPIEWTWAQKNLSLAYLLRKKRRPENVARAIDGLSAVVDRQRDLNSPERLRTIVALAQVLLDEDGTPAAIERATAYLQLAVGEDSGRTTVGAFGGAVQLLEQILAFAQGGDNVELATMIHHSLGVGLVNRSFANIDEPGSIVEQAINHLRPVLKQRSADGNVDLWIDATIHCGRAYRNRVAGSRASNSDEAIRLLRSAIDQMPSGFDPSMRAFAYIELAMAYSLHPSLTDRFALARSALVDGERRAGDPTSTGRSAQLTRTRAFIDFHEMNSTQTTESFRVAVASLQSAISVTSRDADPWTWAELQSQRSTALACLALAGDTEITPPIRELESVLEIYTLETAPIQRCTTALNIASVLAARADWADASPWFGVAAESGESALAARRSGADVLEVVRLCAETRSRWSTCLVELESYDEALQATEFSLARSLALAVAPELMGLGPDDRILFEAVRREIRYCESLERLPAEHPQRAALADRDELFSEARALSAQLRRDTRFAALYAPEALAAATPSGGALVIVNASVFGTHVFVIPDGTRSLDASHVLHLAGVDEETFRAIAAGYRDKPGWILNREVLRGDNGTAEWEAPRAEFEIATAALLDALGRVLMAPLAAHLASLNVSEGSHVAFVVSNHLAAMPIHAAPIGDDRIFLDAYATSYSPSLLGFATSKLRASERDLSGSATAIIDPTGDLASAREEAAAMAAAFGDRVNLLGTDTTVDAAIDACTGSAISHFACHGHYEIASPMRSGLILAHSEVMAIDTVVSRADFRMARLVAFSACESGVSDFSITPSEQISLPNAALEAGAAAVLATLWSVSDRDSAALMATFYRLLSLGSPPPQALRAAQLDLRSKSNGRYPSTWAAYFLTGA
jgi:tetratricopeptide (TPR) repeat protein